MKRRKPLYTYRSSLQGDRVVVDASRDDGAFAIFEIYPNREVALRRISAMNFDSVLPDAVVTEALKLLRGEEPDGPSILAFREPWRHNAVEVEFRLAEEYGEEYGGDNEP